MATDIKARLLDNRYIGQEAMRAEAAAAIATLEEEVERLRKAIVGDNLPKFAEGIDPVTMLDEERKVWREGIDALERKLWVAGDEVLKLRRVVDRVGKPVAECVLTTPMASGEWVSIAVSRCALEEALNARAATDAAGLEVG